ncbi:MAG: molybdenum cofactor biosynthesis protein MoaE [Anaerolineae bacterium]
MQVTIRLFATLRDRAGVSQITLDLSEGATVAQMLEQLVGQHPALDVPLRHAIVALDEEFAFPETPLHDGAEVAIFPPVSGGSGEGAGWPEYIAVTADPPDVNAILAAITRPETGGVAIFSGAVRGVTDQGEQTRATEHLFYEAYTPMAERKLRQIAAEIREKFPRVQGIALVQRIGRLEVGEVTVLVACAAGHRYDGIFEAARYGIDRLKQIVPVWKKEVGPDGSAWVEGEYHPTRDDVRASHD